MSIEKKTANGLSIKFSSFDIIKIEKYVNDSKVHEVNYHKGASSNRSRLETHAKLVISSNLTGKIVCTL